MSVLERVVDTEKASKLKTDDRIMLQITKWVNERNENYHDDRKKIQDYGRVRFTENDRKSWYIRYPFNPPYVNVLQSKPHLCAQQEQITTNASEVSGDRKSFMRLTRLLSNHPVNPDPLLPEPDNVELLSTDPATQLIAFMRDHWEIALPELIISVTGGAQMFKLTQSRIRNAFQKGLVSAAAATDAWVFTGGTYSGVMKEVGDAFEKWTHKSDKTHARVPLIAIASWYYTTDYEQLRQRRPQTNNVDGEIRVNMSDRVADYEKLYRNRFPIKTEVPSSCPIDPNHTHFILLDDMCGPDDKKWKEKGYNVRADLTIQLRAEIEQKARCISNQGQNYKVPIVQILVEGGPSSILTVCEAVNHETSVIIIKGTGRAADLIATAYDILYKNHRTFVQPEHNHPELEMLMNETKAKHFPIINPTNEKLFRDMITSKEGFFLINTFLLQADDSEFKLGNAILEALFRAATMTECETSNAHVQKLKLAMAWNKYDLVVSDIFNESRKTLWTDAQLDNALSDALRHDSVQFVELLVEHGASFDRLRRIIVINELYRKKTVTPLPRTRATIDKQYAYYNEYLNVKALSTMEFFEKQGLIHSSNIYGITEGNREEGTHLSGKVVFNMDDAVRCNGYVTQVCIALSQKNHEENQSEMMHNVTLYIISRTMGSESFQIVHQRPIFPENFAIISNIQKIVIPDSTVYLESGQFLAVGFGKNYSSMPSHLSGRGSSYFLDLDTVNKAYSNNTIIAFDKDVTMCVAISFRLVQTSEFIRDIFLWSIFLSHYNVAVCLCSHSPNTSVASLLASKIYQTAAKSIHDAEKKRECIAKEKEFDVHAARIIDKCFAQNEKFALQILTTKSKLYFGYSPLQLAEETNSRSFLAAKCVQKHLDRLWYGDINQYHHCNAHIDLLMFVLSIFPILVLFPYFDNIIRSCTSKELAKQETKLHKCPGWFIYNRLMNFFNGRAIVSFYYNIIFYVLFLSLFSYIMLVDYFPFNNNNGKRNRLSIGIPVTEIILHSCLWGLIVDEIYEFGMHCHEKLNSSSPKRHVVSSYFREIKWNMLDCIAIFLYLVGFITRFIVIEQVFIVSKIFMCIDLFLWYIRILHLFAAYERLGPKLLMIFKTMKDLVFFIYFILIFLAGYSISSFALISTPDQITWIPNDDGSPSRDYNLTLNGSSLWTWNLLRNVVDWGIWKVYGQVDIIGHNQVGPVSSITAGNDAYGNTVFVLTIIFVCVANVLLLNVLVALFNVTLSEVGENAHDAWAYHRFLLVKEYSKKPQLPPPLSILFYGYKLLKLLGWALWSIKDANIGSLDGSSKLDANVLDLIVFNADDRVIRSAIMSKISVNFCTAPSKSDAIIYVYRIRETPNDPNRFLVKKMDSIITDLKLSTGIQIMTFTKFNVEENDYIGFKFGENAGSPFTVERTSYYTKHDHKNDQEEQEILFTQCASHGISVSFCIKNRRDTQKYVSQNIVYEPIEETPMDWIEDRHQRAIQRKSTQLQNSLPLIEQSTKRKKRKSPTTITNLTNFQERDNMLRECSIAQDYWQLELERIVKEEQDKLCQEKKGRITHEHEQIMLKQQQQELIELLKKTSNNIIDQGSEDIIKRSTYV